MSLAFAEADGALLPVSSFIGEGGLGLLQLMTSRKSCSPYGELQSIEHTKGPEKSHESGSSQILGQGGEMTGPAALPHRAGCSRAGPGCSAGDGR